MDDDGTFPDLANDASHARALASHHGFVRELARGLVAPDAFEDVAHDALLAGLARPPDRAAALRGWLATTVRHLASKWQRGEARRARREVAAARPEALPSARELVERIELEQAVVRAVLALREPFRTTVLLRFYEGHATAAIAQQLRLPADTVRARLRRGLAELRATLDARFGARSHWVVALLPVAALPVGVAPMGLATSGASGTSSAVGSGSAAAKAAAAAATTGAAVMGIKSIGIVAASCATAAFAWWAVPDVWIERALAPKSACIAPTGPAGAESRGFARVDAASAGDGALAATRSVEGASANGDAKAAGDASLPPPGTVLLEVVDARTLAPLEGVKIRFLHPDRFAEYDGAGNVTTALTAGHWEANVAAEGYEPARLAGFDVVVGEARALGRVALERGNGVVEGRVVARQLPDDAPVTVELFGSGRSPCDACLAALNGGEDEAARRTFGADCHFGNDRDVVAATGDRAFKFEHLAAGTYWLRASDAKQRIVESCRIDIGRGGYAWRELDVSAPTFARFELRHERGGLFTGAWANPHRPQPAAIRYEFRRDGVAVGSVEITPSADDTLASVGPPVAIPGGAGEPLLVDLTYQLHELRAQTAYVERSALLTDVASNFVTLGESTWASRLAISTDHVVLPQVERLDRERQEGDALDFDFAEPGCDGVELKIDAIRRDCHEIRPLPRLALTVVVTCGGYASDELPVDLRGDFFQPLVVTMRALPNGALHAAALGTSAAASCTSCHDDATKRDAASALGALWTRNAVRGERVQRLAAWSSTAAERESLDRAEKQ